MTARLLVEQSADLSRRAKLLPSHLKVDTDVDRGQAAAEEGEGVSVGQRLRRVTLKKLVLLAGLVVIATTALAGSAYANHAWSKYHWARTSNPFYLTLGDNTRSDKLVTNWSSLLSNASNAWNASSGPSTVVRTSVGAGDGCGAQAGKVEVCSQDYGDTGWLGVAQVWIYRGGGHIAQGVVQLNDYYFKSGSTYQYNNIAERQHVVCQEVAHTFGLDHQSTNGGSLDTCMDYWHNTSAEDTRSTTPNAGDFGELSCIYDPVFNRRLVSSVVLTAFANYTHTCRGNGHLDSFNSTGATSSYFGHAKPSFARGTRVAKDEYVDHLPDGGLLVTFVTPANR